MDTINTSRVRLNITLSQIQSKGKLLNANSSYQWICQRKHLVGWTYNYNWSCQAIRNFDKLIACQGRTSKTIRIANNTHIKCYIASDSMLLGSFNLTYPTVQDFCVEIKDIASRNYMRRMFNKHWKELE